jgi:KaiC/GvpD/RAD55 family RecA-like ATPase
MPEVIRFGIHSLDELLGIPSEKSEGKSHPGIYLPLIGEEGNEKGDFTTSVCLIGPDGTGKSIFGLHMASTYLADCIASRAKDPKEELPAVLYVSTDFTFNMANRVWRKFALNYPFSRKDPFGPINTRPDLDPKKEIELEQHNPTTLAEEYDLIEKKRGNVIFVDIASYTAGDDWGFLHKLVSLLPKPDNIKAPRHLIVIDAIEGFEALAGELNAFGEKSTRRSRVAQVMRLMAEKCHVLLVVEESRSHEKLAEEFVADTVIQLENISTRNYERRVLKIEKARGQSHIRGQHHYSIRSGNGSTTGSQVNPDDPEILAPFTSVADKKSQSYVQVFHSVHRLNRKIMEVKGKARGKLEPNTYYAAFGIKYLDNMLGGKDETTERKEGQGEYQGYSFDSRGLPCRSTTALIGDSLTQKSTLGKAFLSRCFHSFDTRLAEVHELLKNSHEDEAANRTWELVLRKAKLLSNSSNPINTLWETKGRSLLKKKKWMELLKHVYQEVEPNQLPFPSSGSAAEQLEILLGEEQFKKQVVEKQLRNPGLTRLLNEASLTHLAAWLLDYQSGVAVMLVTHNMHSERLTDEFICWLHSKARLEKLEDEMKGYKKALENYIKGGTICRRLEIHNLSSEILTHIVQQVIKCAQRKILTPEEMMRSDEVYKRSWPIRLVIDDFSTFRDIFPELREDPLLLPTILFHFEREGVTTLIIDTQSGKPDTPIAERFESELRKLVQHNLYTWRVPFYGEGRVAITAIPPFSYEYAGIVRELRWESESLSQENSLLSNEPATVDPHFELYSGLEEGKPQSVPLRVQFYAETPAMETYIDMGNSFLNELFVPSTHTSQTSTPPVIVGVPATNYNEFRDFVYLQRDTRLDYTLVFQVDEFWAMRAPSRRKRAGAFHPQWHYLNAITADITKDKAITDGYFEPDPDADPYKLFQPRKSDRTSKEPLRRRYFYEEYYKDFSDYEQQLKDGKGKDDTLICVRYKDRKSKDDLLIDRVPFTWDFGFLLCQERAWDTRRSFQVWKSGRGPDQEFDTYSVREIWDYLKKEEGAKPVSWRMFIEACKKAAEGQSDRLSKPVTAFDFAQISPESFSCLILEVWFSEIYDTLQRKKEEARLKGDKKEAKELEEEFNNFLNTVSERRLSAPGSKTVKRTETLSTLLKNYWLDLYKSWLLLIEVLNFSDIVGEATALNFDFKSKNTDFSAIASRHWYKTASQCPDEIAAKEPLVAVRLPGHFSVRGDWFLAVSGSSRSIRQAERALDLLSSRRANISRLQLGIGLPTRFPGEESIKGLRTKLISHERGQDNVEYETFLNIGVKDEDKNANSDKDGFYWLWRSSLNDYAHCNRIWHKWLNRMLLSWYRDLLRYRSVWRNSFKVYDDLTSDPPETAEKFAPKDSDLNSKLEKLEKIKDSAPKKYKKEMDAYYKKFKVESVAQLKVRGNFRKLWEVLIKELEQASEADGKVEKGLAVCEQDAP